MMPAEAKVNERRVSCALDRPPATVQTACLNANDAAGLTSRVPASDVDIGIEITCRLKDGFGRAVKGFLLNLLN